MIAELRELDSKIGIWLSILAGLTLFVIVYLIAHPIILIGNDIQAFWCGAHALMEHANPYLNEPLRSCESTHSPAVFQFLSNATTPAPLPPYALALFVPLGLLPFPVARALWWIVLLVATFAVARGISTITGMAPVTAFAASAFAVCAPSIMQGALSPVPIALTVLAALALRRRQWNATAVLLGFAMVEPNIALPACVAVFLFVSQMRLRLIVAGACAIALALLAVGPQVAVSYFTTVLPAHAASEINMLGQFSLTSLLYHAGVPAQTAIHLGSLQYFLLGAAGIYLAARISRQQRDASWLVVLPAGFAVIGGPFVHLTEVAMAIPLACLIVVRRPTAGAGAALFLLAAAPEAWVNWALLAPAAALTVAWLMARCGRYPSLALVARLPLLVLVGIGILWLPLAVHFSGVANANMTHAPLPDPAPTALASVSWMALNARSIAPPVWWPEKIVTLLPLLALVWFGFAQAFPRRLAAPT